MDLGGIEVVLICWFELQLEIQAEKTRTQLGYWICGFGTQSTLKQNYEFGSISVPSDSIRILEITRFNSGERDRAETQKQMYK